MLYNILSKITITNIYFKLISKSTKRTNIIMAYFSDKSVFITGGSRGIGRAAALTFAKAGYNVAFTYNSHADLAQQLCTQIETETQLAALSIKCDVSDYTQVQSAIESSITKFDKIDVLINNAGIAQQKPFCDISHDDWKQMLNVNLTGTFNCCKAVMPYMISRKSGCIINVSSIWGIAGASCEVHYSAAKAGIIGLTKALAKEMGPSNIRVNCVAPGVVDTDMNSNLDIDTIVALKEETPLGIIGTPQNIADVMLFLAKSDSSFITGQVISPNGGIVI